MKAPLKQETNFSHSNEGALWHHKQFLKGAFYLERFCTRLLQLLCISRSFLFNIGIVHPSDMVNHLDTVETGHMRTPSMCSRPPASSFPGFRKAGQEPGNEATHPLDLWMATQVSEIWSTISVK